MSSNKYPSQRHLLAQLLYNLYTQFILQIIADVAAIDIYRLAPLDIYEIKFLSMWRCHLN